MIKKYLCPLFLIVSNIGAGIGYYILYQQNKTLAQKLGQLERKLEVLQQSEPEQLQQEIRKPNLYQRLQMLDNKLGEWIRKR